MGPSKKELVVAGRCDLLLGTVRQDWCVWPLVFVQTKSQLACFTNWPKIFKNLVAGVGFEPTTSGL